MRHQNPPQPPNGDLMVKSAPSRGLTSCVLERVKVGSSRAQRIAQPVLVHTQKIFKVLPWNYFLPPGGPPCWPLF